MSDAKQRHAQAQKRYAEKLKEDGFMRMCIWVPRDEGVKDDIRDYADQRIEQYFND